MNPLSSGPLRRETPSWEIARSGGKELRKARSEDAGGVFRKKSGMGRIREGFSALFLSFLPASEVHRGSRRRRTRVSAPEIARKRGGCR